MDIVDAPTRSRMMAGIGSRNTAPELLLRRALHARGLRFRVHDRSLPGRPDIVLPRWRVVIQVHGCFWHRHQDCRFATTPATRTEFWLKKFEVNVTRDRRVVDELQLQGWRVAVVWECGLRSADLDPLIAPLEAWIRYSDNGHVELPDLPASAAGRPANVTSSRTPSQLLVRSS